MSKDIATPWLTEEFLKRVIKSDLGTDAEITIRDSSCSAAVKSGENYSSSLYRVAVKFAKQNKKRLSKDIHRSYIVKCMHSLETETGRMLKLLNVFLKEFTMYTETIPAMTEIIKKEDPEFQIMARLLYWESSPQELLVLEDLTAGGYKSPSRREGLDKKHCELALTRLAQLHAASMVLNRKNPKFRDNYNMGGFFEGLPESLSSYYTNGVKQAITLMKDMPDCGKYVKYFSEYVEVMVERGLELCKKVPEEKDAYNVLNHGDFWLTNMMFKYDEKNNPISVKFVDFQMSTFNTPGLDLNYFLFTSMAEDMREQYRVELLKKYQSVLAATLTALKHEGFIPTYKDLQQALLESKDIAVMTPCIVLPLVKLDTVTSETISVEKIMDSSNSETMQQIFTNKPYLQSLKLALQLLEKLGYIEAE